MKKMGIFVAVWLGIISAALVLGGSMECLEHALGETCFVVVGMVVIVIISAVLAHDILTS